VEWKVKRELEGEQEDGGSASKKLKKEESDDDLLLKKAPTVSSCVLVTGTDWKDKAMQEKLKSLGATWCKPLLGWVLPESTRNAVQKLVDGGEVSAVDKNAGKDGGQQDDPKPSVKAGATLYIAPHKKAILVSGETQKVKDTLKALNGSWNKFLSGHPITLHKIPVWSRCTAFGHTLLQSVYVYV
jgi:hypothetical protein